MLGGTLLNFVITLVCLFVRSCLIVAQFVCRFVTELHSVAGCGMRAIMRNVPASFWHKLALWALNCAVLCWRPRHNAALLLLLLC